MIEYKNGDILREDVEALVNPVTVSVLWGEDSLFNSVTTVARSSKTRKYEESAYFQREVENLKIDPKADSLPPILKGKNNSAS